MEFTGHRRPTPTEPGGVALGQAAIKVSRDNTLHYAKPGLWLNVMTTGHRTFAKLWTHGTWGFSWIFQYPDDQGKMPERALLLATWNDVKLGG